MRNLKKVLSLALALVMLVGMMVVGAGALDSGFIDDGDINDDYKEAVTVMNAVNIIVGDDTGNANPEKLVRRSEAAKILVAMQMRSLPPVNTAGVSDYFTDVRGASGWAAFYVDYCANLGIIVGKSDTIFDPNGNVTGYEFGKMLLVTLGQDPSTFTTSGWKSVVMKDILDMGLNEVVSVSNWDAPLTREQAAQLAFNALNYTEKGAETGRYIITVEASADATVKALAGETVSSRSEALMLVNAVATGNKTYGTHWNLTPETDNSGSLAAEVFGLSSTTTIDAFGNPTKTWTSSKDSELEIVVEKDAAATFDTKVSPSQIYNALGLKVASKSASYTVDGMAQTPENLTKSDTTKDIGAVGAVTKAYLTGSDVSIVTVNNYLAKVTKVTEAKEATSTAAAVDASVTVEVYGVKASEATLTGRTFKTDGYAKDDYVIVTVKKTATVDGSDWTIESMEPAEAIEGAITAYTTTSITVEGEKYSIAATNTGLNAKKTDPSSIGFSSTWVYYLKDGVILGGEVKTASVSTDYVYVATLETSSGSSILGGSANRAVVDATFTDGTHEVIDLALTSNGVGGYTYAKPASDGTVAASTALATIGEGDAGNAVDNWFAYTVDDDGKYTLSQIDTDYANVATNPVLTKNQPSSLGSKYTNNSTVVAFTDSDNKLTTATGLVGVSLTGKVLYTYAKGSNIVSAVYAVNQASATVDNQTYAYALSKGSTVKDGTEWTFAIDGEEVTKIVRTGASVTKGKIYTLAEGSNDTVTPTEYTDPSTLVAAAQVTTADDSFFVAENAGATMYLIDESTKVYNVTENADPAGAVDEIEKDDWVVVIHDGQPTKTAKVVYIVDAPPTPSVTSVAIDGGDVTVVKGASKTFTATVAVVGGAPATVTWTVEGAGDGTTTAINSSTGVLTIDAGETAAELTVTATSTEDATKKDSVTVTVGTCDHDGARTQHAATTGADCQTKGTKEYYTCDACGTKFQANTGTDVATDAWIADGVAGPHAAIENPSSASDYVQGTGANDGKHSVKCQHGDHAADESSWTTCSGTWTHDQTGSGTCVKKCDGCERQLDSFVNSSNTCDGSDH